MSSNSPPAQSLSRPLPPGTWDSHMHVVNPQQYPLSATAKYTPPAHTLQDMYKFYAPLSITKMVFVQPSIYATNNKCMLDALSEVGPENGRAVVEIDPHNTSEQTLLKWHDMGVRGVRVNLVSVGRDLNADELKSELQAYVDVIRPMKSWVLQVYIPMKTAVVLNELDSKEFFNGVKLCIDHFGSPSLPSFPADAHAYTDVDPYSIDGFAALVALLERGNTFVKLSAPYRISKDPDTSKMRDLDGIGRELIAKAPERVVYATDWPHTRFEGVDSQPFIEVCYRWCGGDEGMIERLFRRNAEVLWDARSK